MAEKPAFSGFLIIMVSIDNALRRSVFRAASRVSAGSSWYITGSAGCSSRFQQELQEFEATLSVSGNTLEPFPRSPRP